MLFCLECLSSGIWSDSHALREAARGKGKMRDAELLREMMCLAVRFPPSAGGGRDRGRRLLRYPEMDSGCLPPHPFHPCP